MDNRYDKKYIEECIKHHHRWHDGNLCLNSLNVEKASIVINLDTIIYKDEYNDEYLYYEIPFIKGDPSNGYNEKFAWKHILTNKNKINKLLTVGKNPKLEHVTLFPEIIEWKERKCIKLDKSCNLHESSRRKSSYRKSLYCIGCGEYCPDYLRCYDCNNYY